MKWFLAAVLLLALLLAGYSVYRGKRVEAAMTPRVRLIANAAR